MGSKTKNEMFDLVNEYLVRKRLAKLGFTASDLKKLDGEHAMNLLLVDHAIEKETSAQSKRKNK